MIGSEIIMLWYYMVYSGHALGPPTASLHSKIGGIDY